MQCAQIVCDQLDRLLHVLKLTVILWPLRCPRLCVAQRRIGLGKVGSGPVEVLRHQVVDALLNHEVVLLLAH